MSHLCDEIAAPERSLSRQVLNPLKFGSVYEEHPAIAQSAFGP